MAKERRINEIPGITGAAAVQLTRMGVVTLADLVAADFDRVAYVLEDYKEATRLVTEAQKMIKGRKTQGHPAVKVDSGHPTEHIVPQRPPAETPEAAAAPEAKAPARPEGLTAMPRVPRIGAMTPPRAEPPAPRAEAAPAATPPAEAAPAPERADSALSAALALCARGAALSGPMENECRQGLARRLAVAELLLRSAGTEAELVAALLTEPVENGAVSPTEAVSRFGPEAWQVIEQVTALRAVPLLPTGRPPRYYLDMAAAATAPARRVCAALLTQSLSAGGGGTLFHARLLLEALRSGGRDELLEIAEAAVERAAGEQAGKMAA